MVRGTNCAHLLEGLFEVLANYLVEILAWYSRRVVRLISAVRFSKSPGEDFDNPTGNFWFLGEHLGEIVMKYL